MKGKDQDIFESDAAFISFGGSMLFGIGLTMLFLGLSCGFFGDWGFCNLNLISFPFIEAFFKPEFISINLPLGMVIIGIGLQLFSKTGWVISVFVMALLLVLFGSSSYLLISGVTHQGWDFPYIPQAALNTSISILLILSLVYMVTRQVRELYG
ncbi:hypothetical protein N9933_02245 [bacterium]|nr:hypothetical protein [bacterium]